MTERPLAGRLPGFVVIGAMRSGTSSLAAYLAGHPGVFVVDRKEIHFFNRFYERGTDWYRSLFADVGESVVWGEATPVYMFDPVAFARMAQLLPDTKVIAVLREPVARAYSHYWFNRTRGNEKESFDRAIELEAFRVRRADQLARTRYSYFGMGFYAEQLERVLAAYPPDRVHVLLFDDLLGAPVEAFSAVCRFLGVDAEVEPAKLGDQVNAFYRNRWPALHKAVKSAPRPLRRAIGLVNRTSAPGYPPIPSEVAQTLAVAYAEPNRRLATLLGRPLDEWERR